VNWGMQNDRFTISIVPISRKFDPGADDVTNYKPLPGDSKTSCHSNRPRTPDIAIISLGAKLMAAGNDLVFLNCFAANLAVNISCGAPLRAQVVAI